MLDVKNFFLTAEAAFILYYSSSFQNDALCEMTQILITGEFEGVRPLGWIS